MVRIRVGSPYSCQCKSINHDTHSWIVDYKEEQALFMAKKQDLEELGYYTKVRIDISQ